jgi:hypothetical protein
LFDDTIKIVWKGKNKKKAKQVSYNLRILAISGMGLYGSVCLLAMGHRLKRSLKTPVHFDLHLYYIYRMGESREELFTYMREKWEKENR